MILVNIISTVVPPIYGAAADVTRRALAVFQSEQPQPKPRLHVVHEKVRHHKNPRTRKGVEIRGVMAHLWSHNVATDIRRALRDGVDFELHVHFGDHGYHDTFRFNMSFIAEHVERTMRSMFRGDPRYTVDEFDELATHEVHSITEERGVKGKPMERLVVIRVSAHEVRAA